MHLISESQVTTQENPNMKITKKGNISHKKGNRSHLLLNTGGTAHLTMPRTPRHSLMVKDTVAFWGRGGGGRDERGPRHSLMVKDTVAFWGRGGVEMRGDQDTPSWWRTLSLSEEGGGLDVLYVCDVIININVRYVIINRFLRYIQ